MFEIPLVVYDTKVHLAKNSMINTICIKLLGKRFRKLSIDNLESTFSGCVLILKFCSIFFDGKQIPELYECGSFPYGTINDLHFQQLRNSLTSGHAHCKRKPLILPCPTLWPSMTTRTLGGEQKVETMIDMVLALVVE